MDLPALYDVPDITAEFAGGPWAGKRMAMSDDRDVWYTPVPADLSVWASIEPQPVTPTMQVCRYRKYRIADDGTRWFRPDQH